MANDFDPDAFLAEGGGFDPDAFLSETAETPAVTAPEVGEPSRARRVLFGLAKTPGLVEEAVQLIEQKAGARPEEREVITRQTLRHPDVPEDVPLTPEEMEEAEMVTQTIHKVTPGRTEQEIRDEQAARRQSRLAQDFPDLVEDGTLEDDPWVTTGEVTRLVTDLITVPLPVAQQAKLGKMAAQGEKVMGSAAGRAQLGKAVTEGALGIGAFGAADNTIRQLSATGQLNAEELGYAALISGAAGGTLGPALFAGGGKVLKYLNRKHAADADVTADDIINTGAEIDVVITRPEAEEILAASNRLRDITRVEARTLDDAFGIKTADEIKAKTDARRADLIEAYRKDAEHADFQKRKADEIQQRRDLARARRNTPYEALDKQREAEIERGFAAIEEAEEGIITPGEMGQLDPSRSPLVIPKSPLRVDHSFHRPTIDEYAVARITERQNEELARL
ncbi:MAG: hypothetical protein GWN58_28090, partial [Anaerolineae bacterium]|nr:hypothetical protein [Anaerolineae bacterium]